MATMDPVVELSGEISEVEDFSHASAIMQSSESSLSIHDEDEYTDGGLEISKGAATTVPVTGPSKKRFYATAIVLVTLFAGCGYIVTSRELSKNADTKDQEGLSAFSVTTPPSALNSTNASALPLPTPPHGYPVVVPPATWPSTIDGDALAHSGSAFQIALRHANGTNDSSYALCLDLFDAFEATDSTPSSARALAFRECSESPDTTQAFVYDPLNFFITSKHFKGMCIDSSHVGGDAAGAPHARALRLHSCGLKMWNQMFAFAPERGTFKSTHLETCIAGVAGPGRSGGMQIQATLQPCAEPHTTTLRPVSTRIWDVTHPILISGEQFLLRSVGKLDLCLSAGLATSNRTDADSRVLVARCAPSQESQRLTYDAHMHWIRSAGSPGLCLDDNEAWLPDPNDAGVDPTAPAINGVNHTAAPARMAPCDELSYNQKFVYDAFARTFRSPTKPGLCLDDGGGSSAQSSAFRMAECELAQGNQQFALDRVARPRELPQDAQAFSIESLYKELCVAIDFRLRECDRDAPAQRFTYDSKRKSLHSAAEPSHCWSRSAQPASAAYFGVAFLSLAPCDAEDARQRFETDAATATLRSVGTQEGSGGLCLDGGGGWFALETPLALRECDEHSVRQRFRIWR